MSISQTDLEQQSTEFYYIPYKEFKLQVKFFKPTILSTKTSTCILFIHWMDARGYRGNPIYNQLGEYYSQTQGIPVFIYDILGSGNSKGKFEFPKNQKDQVATVYHHIIEKLANEYASEMTWNIIPIAHSISIIALMSAISEGLLVSKLIWIGGPPSHTKSFKYDIQKRGRLAWYSYYFLSRLDIVSGKFGLPFSRNIFGFKLRLKDIRKYFSDVHGAKMLLSHPDIDALAIFGSEDEYMSQADITEEFGYFEDGKYTKNVKIIVLNGANHSFKGRTEELKKYIFQFIDKV